VAAIPKRVRLGIAVLLGAAVVASLAAAGSFGGGAVMRRAGHPHPALASLSGSATAGTTARFAFLARRTTNSCGLEPAVLERMPGRMRLQGSCCFPMNEAAYQSQVRRLRAYATIPQIPADPYDVPVTLAKRLLSYDRAIRLGPGQARTYSRAMRISTLKGPCCCHCWRWEAFRGLSRYLIADRRWGAPQLARVIDLLEGCGGPAA
jgi:hypothetical protein